MTIVIVLVAVLLVGGAFMLVRQTALDTDSPISVTDCADSTSTITFPARNGINKGTSVTPTANVMVNGQPAVRHTSGDAYPVGANLKVLYNASDYIDVIGDEFTVSCGQTQAPVQDIYATSTNTFRVFNTDGNALTDTTTAGIVNQTDSSAPISLDIKIDSTSDESTGDLVIVIEGTNTTNIDSIVLSGLGGANKVSVPEFYSDNSANALTVAYEVPAVLDGASVQGTLSISPESGQTLGGSGVVQPVYITAYSKQAFTDVDGSFQIGVENSDGTAKYEDTWDSDFIFAV